MDNPDEPTSSVRRHNENKKAEGKAPVRQVNLSSYYMLLLHALKTGSYNLPLRYQLVLSKKFRKNLPSTCNPNGKHTFIIFITFYSALTRLSPLPQRSRPMRRRWTTQTNPPRACGATRRPKGKPLCIR